MLIQRSLSSAGFFSCYYWKYEMQLWLWLVSWAPTEPLSGVNTEKIIVINIYDEGLSLAAPALNYFPSKEILSPVLNFNIKKNLIELSVSQTLGHMLLVAITISPIVSAICFSCLYYLSTFYISDWLNYLISSAFFFLLNVTFKWISPQEMRVYQLIWSVLSTGNISLDWVVGSPSYNNVL